MTQNWLTDALVEPLAITICYGTFGDPNAVKVPPEEYWAGVREDAKADYRASARHLLLAALGGCRIMTREPPEEALVAYMRAVGLADRNRAMKQFRAMHANLPTMWQLGKQPAPAA